MVVVDESLQDFAQMSLVEDDDMVRAFSANGADDALNVWVLPRSRDETEQDQHQKRNGRPMRRSNDARF